MRKRLARSVSFWSESGELITFLPGDEPPAEYAQLISNPSAWEQETMSAPEPSTGNYEDMTVAQLTQMAKDRNIDLTGVSKKAEVISRLEADDAADGSGTDSST